MKRILSWTIALLLALLFVFAVRHVWKRHGQLRREVGYQSTLRSYSEVLKPGMTRKDVEGYLRAQKVEFRQMCCVNVQLSQKAPWDDLVKIGEEDAPWYCSSNNVYVAFEFSSDEPFKGMWRADDRDKLQSVAIHRWLETCL